MLELSNETIPQIIMPCHALRSPVIPSTESINNYMYDGIGIGIFQNSFMVIFQRTYSELDNNSINRHYKLLTIHSPFTTFTVRRVPDRILHYQPVRSMKLFSILDEYTDHKDVIKEIYNFGKYVLFSYCSLDIKKILNLKTFTTHLSFVNLKGYLNSHPKRLTLQLNSWLNAGFTMIYT